MVKLFKFLLVAPFIVSSYAQGQEGCIEGGSIYTSGKQMPYYIISNQAGKFATMKSGGYLRVNIFSTPLLADSTSFHWFYGIDIIDRYDSHNNLELYQGFTGIQYKFLQLWAGKRIDFYGNQDTLLSSGGTVWSGNAPPIPKIMLSTRTFVPLFHLRWLNVSLGIAHGWIGYDQSYIRNPYLHQKYFYFRLGNPQTIAFTAGIQHYAQWGGISPKYGQLPDDFKNFLKVFFAYNNEDRLDPTHSGMPENEARNRIGNHVGTKDFGLDFIYRGWKVKMYWQNFIEDITGVGFRNAMDGLWGISIKPIHQLNFNYEYVHTYTYFVTEENKTLLDDYFNNTVYLSGWTYKGYVIGTPLITSPVLLADSLIGKKLTNNRVIAHHLGINYSPLRNLSITIHYIYSKNYGASIIHFNPMIQHYMAMHMYIPEILPRLSLKTTIAYDKGELLENKWGLNISVAYLIDYSTIKAHLPHR